jgi:hypothetical protein
LTTRPNEKEFLGNLKKFTANIQARQEVSQIKKIGTCYYSAVASCAYTNSNKAQYPEKFGEYMRSAR